MAILDINLIQQQQGLALRLKQANVVVAVVAGAIIGLQLLIVVFLFSTTEIRKNQKNGLVSEQQSLQGKIAGLDKQDNQFYPGMTLSQQAASYQAQVDGSRDLIGNHKYFTLYLSEIALNTPKTIVLSSFTSDSASKLTVLGSADSYSDVSKLVESFGRLSLCTSATIQDAKLDTQKVGKGQAVKFTLVIELKSAAELKKLPTPPAPRRAGHPPHPGRALRPKPPAHPLRCLCQA
ncbi:MAG: PilN domain-containing protein [Hymenobacter sp.]